MTAHQRWTRRLATAGTATLAVLTVSGIAYAAWSQTGAGTGSAGAVATVPLTAVAAVSAGLHPGSAANLTVTVTNPNPRAVTVTSIGSNGAVTARAGCTTPGVSVTLPATVSVSVPAGGSAPLTLPNAVAMSTASSSDCQGATFTIALTVTGRTA